MIVCAGQSEQFSFAEPIGIGLTDVAINLTQLCMLKPPEFLLFVGTAGSYGEKKIFDIVESRTATNIENSFFTGSSYTPIDNMISSASDGTFATSSLLNASHVSRETCEADDNSLSSIGLKPERWSKATREGWETLVNSSNYITTDKSMGKHYLSKNIGLENMEFYAVLKVAKKFDIPAVGVFIVTNYCDEHAHKDFMANQKEAMNKLTEYMRKRVNSEQTGSRYQPAT